MKKIMVYAGDNSESILPIVSQIGNVLANYGQSILIATDDNGPQALQNNSLRFREIPEQPLLQTGAFMVDTANVNIHSTSSLAFERSVKAIDSDKSYNILRLAGPMHPDWKTQLESNGVRFERSLDEFFYLVEIENDKIDTVQQFFFVESITTYEPELKVNPALFSTPFKANLEIKSGLKLLDIPEVMTDIKKEDHIIDVSRSPKYSEEADGNIEVVIKPAAIDLARPAIESAGGKIISVLEDRIIVYATDEVIMNIAKIEEVKDVNPFSPFKLHNDVAGTIMHVDPIHNNHGFRGTGQIVAVADTGLDTGVDNSGMIADFRGRIIKIESLGRPGNASDTDGHGTHVAGSVLGNGTNSNNNIQGMAPEAKLFFQSVLDSSGGLGGLPSNLKNLFSPALQNGANIHTNSWGFTRGDGTYNTNAMNADEFAFQNPKFLILFAAGNEGRKIPNNKITPPGTAKNVLTIGASKSLRVLPASVSFPTSPKFPTGITTTMFSSEANSQDHVADFSSLGPAQNNRRKPDIVAPGSWILSVRSTVAVADNGPDGIPDTGDETGVSAHSEAVGLGLPGGPIFGGGNQNTPPLPFGSGTGADQLYMYQSGTSMATPIVAGACSLLREFLIKDRGHSPSAALIKAFAINGAIDMGMGVPHQAQGWGRLDLSNAMAATVKFDDKLNNAVNTGDIRVYDVSISSSLNPFTVTLVWRDAAGPTIQNRLHLRVTHLVSNTTLVSDPINDIRNNVQKVIFKNPVPGNYRIEVEGVNISTGISEFVNAIRQDYALVVSNATGAGLL